MIDKSAAAFGLAMALIVFIVCATVLVALKMMSLVVWATLIMVMFLLLFIKSY